MQATVPRSLFGVAVTIVDIVRESRKAIGGWAVQTCASGITMGNKLPAIPFVS